ncbi:MAG: NAD-dependent epimerase/dehydratase family protein, partial [Planctomycetaceae bacterium]
MSLTRRSFVRAVAGSAVGFGVLPVSDLGERSPPRAGQARNILILGGTNYIGPHLVHQALERGHRITTFTRGRRQPTLYADLFDRVEQLEGDREGDLESLRGGSWDIVVDNSATNPKWVADSAALLRGAVDRYLFVSSTGVFLPYLRPDIDDSVQPRLEDPPGTPRPSYGVQKARAEREAVAAFGDAAVIVRPHFIVGPGDSSDRFPYWPVRIERCGEVFVPGRRSDAVQHRCARSGRVHGAPHRKRRVRRLQRGRSTHDADDGGLRPRGRQHDRHGCEVDVG